MMPDDVGPKLGLGKFKWFCKICSCNRCSQRWCLLVYKSSVV